MADVLFPWINTLLHGHKVSEETFSVDVYLKLWYVKLFSRFTEIYIK